MTTTSEDALAEAFPAVDAGVQPFGSRVLVQIRTPKKKVGSILLVQDTKDTEKWNTQVAKVIAVGSLAYGRKASGASRAISCACRSTAGTAGKFR